MTIAGLTQTEMLAILKANGYDVIDNKYWELEGVERVMMGKGTNSFPFKLKKFYPYYEVVKKATMLAISIIPEECRESFHHCMSAFDQHAALVQRTKEKKEQGNSESQVEKNDSSNQEPKGSL